MTPEQLTELRRYDQHAVLWYPAISLGVVMAHIDAQAARIQEVAAQRDERDERVIVLCDRIAQLEADLLHARAWVAEWKHRALDDLLDEPSEWPPESASDGWSGELTRVLAQEVTR